MPSVSNHPTLECPQDFGAAILFSQSEDGEPLLVPMISTTFQIENNRLVPVPEQPDIKLAGEHWGEPGISSLKLEPQIAFMKPATDVVLIGHAFSGGRSVVDVTLRVGSLRQTARVTGDRYWVKTFTGIEATAPEPFESMPLTFERAFGGWDRSLPDPTCHGFEKRNPVGAGFRLKNGRFEDGIKLPNVEHPSQPLREYGDTPAPVGFGFIAPHWQPRAAFAGTYDQVWQRERMPLLPLDFDRRFFNAAAPGLIGQGYLQGNEPVWIENVSPHGVLSFNLPGVFAPQCGIRMKGNYDARVATNLDTVIIDSDAGLVTMLWRGHMAVRNGPLDALSIRVQPGGAYHQAAH